MIYTKEQFKKLWDANDEGSGITFEDMADCAKHWGLYDKPKIHKISTVKEKVLESAKCETGRNCKL